MHKYQYLNRLKNKTRYLNKRLENNPVMTFVVDAKKFVLT